MKIVQVIPKGKNSVVAVSGVNTIFRNAKQADASNLYTKIKNRTSKTIY